MPSNYPDALPDAPGTHQDVQDDVAAIAAELGTNPSGAAATVASAIAGKAEAAHGAHVPDPAAEPDDRWLKTASGALVYTGAPASASQPWPLKGRAGRVLANIGSGNGGFVYGDSVAFLIPVPLAATTTIDAIYIDVTNGGTQPASVIRLGLYTDDNGLPGGLLIDGGLVAGTAAKQTLAITPTACPAGIVWVAVAPQGSPATKPSLRYASAISGLLSLPTTFNVQYTEGMFIQGSVPGALPAVLAGPIPYTENHVIRCWLKVA